MICLVVLQDEKTRSISSVVKIQVTPVLYTIVLRTMKMARCIGEKRLEWQLFGYRQLEERIFYEILCFSDLCYAQKISWT